MASTGWIECKDLVFKMFHPTPAPPEDSPEKSGKAESGRGRSDIQFTHKHNRHTMKKNIIIAILCAAATVASAQTITETVTSNQTITVDTTGVAPTLYALTQESDALPPSGGIEGGLTTGGIEGGKTLGIFKSAKQAKTFTTLAGFTLIAAGAYLGGKAEMHRMYHGTTRNGDTFHNTRDAGLIVTGAGAACIGASVVIGEKVRPLEIIWKAAASAILYRITAEATYNATKPR